MPNERRQNEVEVPSPRQARDETQLILGQIHGLVWLAAQEANLWPKSEPGSESNEPELTADDVRQAAMEVHPHFGTVHAALNTGLYDEHLVKAGLSGRQGYAKKKGLLSAISRYFNTSRNAIRDSLVRLRAGLGWSATIVGSLTTALGKEIERVPGAALAGEAIREFLEVLSRAAEASEKALPTTGAKSSRGGEDRES